MVWVIQITYRLGQITLPGSDYMVAFFVALCPKSVRLKMFHVILVGGEPATLQ